MKKHSPNVPREVRDITDGLFAQAAALIETRRTEAAILFLEKILMYEPEDENVVALIGTLYSVLEDDARTIEYSRRAIKLNPTCSQAYYNLAMVVIDREYKEEAPHAIEMASLAVKYSPEEITYFMALVEAYVLSGNLDEAYRLAHVMLKSWPAEERPHRALGFVCLRRKEWAESERHSRRALAINPESQLAFLNLGVALNNQGKREEAREAFLRSGRLDPADKKFHENLEAEFPEGIFMFGRVASAEK